MTAPEQITVSAPPRLPAMAHAAPTVQAAFVDAWYAAGAALDPALYDLAKSRVEDVVERSQANIDAAGGPWHEAAVAVADQFVEYVPDIDEELLAPLREHLGEKGLRDFVEALYILDQGTRLRITHGVLFDADEFPAVGDAPAPGRLSRPTRANTRYHDSVLAREEHLVRNALQDPTRELVRLRGGAYHQCDLCNSLRLVDQDEQDVPIVGPDLERRLVDYEASDLDEAQKAALTYADAHMVDPRRVDAALRERLRASFTLEQIVQLTLEVSSWNYQKVLVALSIDVPVSAEGLTAFTIGDHGSLNFGKVLAS